MHILLIVDSISVAITPTSPDNFSLQEKLLAKNILPIKQDDEQLGRSAEELPKNGTILSWLFFLPTVSLEKKQ